MENANAKKYLNYHRWLADEFSRRMQKNSRFSIRSFAQLLRMDSSTVSQIIQGKRSVSAKIIEKIADILLAPAEQKKQLINYANAHSRKNKTKILISNNENDFHLITQDMFAVIAQWHHYAILELTFIDGFKNNPSWIARKLKITAAEAKLAITRLIHIGLLKNVDGKLIKSEQFTTNFKFGDTSTALRQFQKQVIQKSLHAIENTHPEEKDITSMTMAIDESKLDEARILISQFRRNLSNYLEKGTKTRVYNLAIQLYPLT